MTPDLYRLVYYSRNRFTGTRDDAAAEIAQILATSRRNNARAQVSGALIFNAGCFGQVLEGSRAAIEATFERIQCDPRHSDVSLLAYDPVETRAFSTWAMAFVGSDVADARRYAGIAVDSGFDPSRMTAERMFDVLHRLALDEEDAGSLANHADPRQHQGTNVSADRHY